MINKEKCSGCSACENICPTNAITLKIDNLTGFKLVEIDTTKCINCGKCNSVCPHIYDKSKNNEIGQEKYALQASKEIRSVSSSGGAFTILANYYSKLGYKIVGVQWNQDWHAEYAIAETEEEWHRFRGSKYMQPDTKDIFPKIKQLLDNNENVLFTGVPCHVSGLLNFLEKKYNNLVTIDLFCGALSSPLIWDKWYEYQKIDKKNIKNINMRAKNGQGNNVHLIHIEEKDGQIHNIPYKCSMAGEIVGKKTWSLPVCHECKYRDMNRVSDYTIADLWNSAKSCPELHCKTDSQVSMFLCNSDEAKKVVKLLQTDENIIIKEIDSVKAPQNFDKKDTKTIFERLQNNGIGKPQKNTKEKPYDIGICGGTFNNNFGATLTYYALYRYLELQGYKTILLPPSEKLFKGGMQEGNILDKYCNVASNYFKINITKFNELSNTFILGSDQMWNPNCALYKNLQTKCFLDYIKDDKKKIAYSTSFGGKVFPQDNNYNRIKRLLDEFDAISCREESGCDLLKEHCNIDAQHTIDPVFLLPIEEYDKLIEDSKVELPNGEYGCYYANTPNQEIIDFYHELNKKLGLKEVTICNGQLPATKKLKEKFPSEKFVNPILAQDWLKYIKNAKYVITSSFHCICFCIMYNIPFICTASLKNVRMDWIMGSTDLKRNCLHGKLKCDSAINLINIPLNDSKNKLLPFINYSKEWLKNVLNKPSVNKIRDKKNNKVALCIISKWEEQYLKEYVEHYKLLGFNNILFYDNNELNDNKQYDVLKPYIDEGFVIYHDWKGKSGNGVQKDAYKDCVKKYNEKYDWIAFFDADEFLELVEHKTIQDFLNSNEKFNDFDGIVFNWVICGDNNLIFNDGRDLKNRFDYDTNRKKCRVFKTIVNTRKIKKINKKNTTSVHRPFAKVNNICDIHGLSCHMEPTAINTSKFFCGDKSYLLHYLTKTLDEFLKKIKRGDINNRSKIEASSCYKERLNYFVHRFFKYNKITKEKLFYIERLYGDDIDLSPYYDKIKNENDNRKETINYIQLYKYIKIKAGGRKLNKKNN